MTDKATYFDENYNTSWISPSIATKITSFLVKYDFSVLDAKQLRDFMIKFIEKEKDSAVIVFSMDKAPDTVLDHNDANSLIRQFLDAGGRIVWIGDIPFWHIGKALNWLAIEKNQKKAELYYQTTAHMAVLGVNPVIRTASAGTVKITRKGKNFGLRYTWSGARPIDVSKKLGFRFWWQNITSTIINDNSIPISFNLGYIPKDERIIILAKSQYLTARPVILLKKRSRFRVGSAKISLPPKVDVALDNVEEEEAGPYDREFWKTYANAWFKNFNRSKPMSGFIRIWDYVPRVMTDNMLEDLLRISLYGSDDFKED